MDLVKFTMLKWAFNPNLRPKTVEGPVENDYFNTVYDLPVKRKKIKIRRRSSTSTDIGVNRRLR